ncbi:hypothetical protein MMC29_007131 [Sticta canariensis]|nr:hypothetical protein [Sticta canariensis]
MPGHLIIHGDATSQNRYGNDDDNDNGSDSGNDPDPDSDYDDDNGDDARFSRRFSAGDILYIQIAGLHVHTV